MGIPVAASHQIQDGEIREIYLKRLQRLQQLRCRHIQDLNEKGIHLLNRSLFATYCDCRDVGAENEARAILGEINLDRERQLRFAFI